MLEFSIEGKVKPKQSFRYSRFGHNYTPSDVKDYARFVQRSFYQTYPKHLPSVFYEMPLRIEIEIYLKVPDNFSKKKKIQALEHEIRPTKKPDIDNCTKNILDALNGIVYADDKQIVEMTVKKFYDVKDFVIVRISAIKNPSKIN